MTQQPKPYNLLRSSLIIAALAAVILAAAAFIRQPQTALADRPKFYLKCDTTQVREGDSFEVTLVRVTNHQHGYGTYFGAAWHTDVGTAKTSDFTNRNDTSILWGSLDDSYDNEINETFYTTSDSQPEINETFTVRFTPTSNVVDMNNPDRDNKCEITIIDDDQPRITNLKAISSPARDNTYGVGEVIEIEATFSTNVNVDDDENPGLGLWIGSKWDAARYLRQPAKNKVVFGYTVKSGDRDSDGFSMPNGYKDSSGTWHNFINYSAITAVGQDYSGIPALRTYSGIGNQANHKIDGSLAPVGTKTEITSSPAQGDTYRYGETIDIAVTFNVPLDVEGSRHLDLRMGDGDAWWRGASYKSGSGTNTLVFGYTVKAEDRDDTGLAMLGTYTSGGQLHGLGGSGKVKVANTDTEVYPTFSGLSNQSDHKVDGRPYPKDISITSTPTAKSDTYGREEVIQVSVEFDQNVTAGEDVIAILRIGGVFIQGNAAYVSGNGSPTLVFEYTVAADDSDDNGIDAFVPHGQDIKASGTNVAYVPNPGGVTPEMGEDSNHKVDGSLDKVPPVISSVALTSSYFGDKQAYGTGDRVQVTVTFDESVFVNGTPKLRLNVGGQTRQASYWNRGGGIARKVAVFRYYAVEGDNDSNGISIDANSLILAGGTIRDKNGNDADLAHSAVADDPDHKVDAPDVTGPTVSSVAITSNPGDENSDENAYVAGDTIEFSVSFNENITVTGSPQLTFNLGDGTRTADYSSSSGSTAVFTYTVVIGDTDRDGISVDSDGLGLNGGTIQDSAGNDASLTINSTIADNPGHKVMAPGGI